MRHLLDDPPIPDMPSTKPRLLFIYLEPSSFVRDDLAVLGERYDVRPFHFDAARARSAVGLATLLARQLRWLLREMPRADVVFGWFADYHMVLPTLLARRHGTPVAVSLGGFDCIRLPELDYGIFCSTWRAPLARYVHRNASVLLPVSGSLIETENAFSSWPRRRANGVRVHVPGLQTPHVVMPTGYDPELWTLGPPAREAIVRTVALVDSERTLRRKGIDLFFRTAAYLPDVTFEVVGVSEAMMAPIRARYDLPANVRLAGRVPRERLAGLYAETSVYLQLSRAEGMPNVLCEAMLCGCIPVGSAVFGIPDAIGDAGYVVDRPDPERIAGLVRRALGADAEARERARARIAGRFHRDRRVRGLVHTFEALRQDPGALRAVPETPRQPLRQTPRP